MVIIVFAIRLKELRKASGVTQKEFAKRMNISLSAVAMWETSQREPDHETVCAVSDYFSVTTDYLLGKSDIPHRAVVLESVAPSQNTSLQEQILNNTELSEEGTEFLLQQLNWAKKNDARAVNAALSKPNKTEELVSVYKAAESTTGREHVVFLESKAEMDRLRSLPRVTSKDDL